MHRRESLSKAVQARKPILLFRSKKYTIELIPLNYRIYVFLPKRPKFKTIDRDSYSAPEFGIEYAHEVARNKINRYFIDDLQE